MKGNNLSYNGPSNFTGEGTNCAGAAARPVSPDEALIQSIAAEQDATRSLIVDLEQKLGRVLGTAGEQGAKDDARPGMATPLLNELAALRDTQEGLNAYLRTLLARVVL